MCRATLSNLRAYLAGCAGMSHQLAHDSNNLARVYDWAKLDYQVHLGSALAYDAVVALLDQSLTVSDQPGDPIVKALCTPRGIS